MQTPPNPRGERPRRSAYERAACIVAGIFGIVTAFFSAPTVHRWTLGPVLDHAAGAYGLAEADAVAIAWMALVSLLVAVLAFLGFLVALMAGVPAILSRLF